MIAITNEDNMTLMARYPDKYFDLAIVDPPYLPQVRDPGEDYRYELSEAEHILLAEKLNGTEGAVLVSGYGSDLYDDLYRGWIRREKKTRANGHGERTEVLLMKGIDLGLFKEVYQNKEDVYG